MKFWYIHTNKMQGNVKKEMEMGRAKFRQHASRGREQRLCQDWRIMDEWLSQGDGYKHNCYSIRTFNLEFIRQAQPHSFLTVRIENRLFVLLI